MRYPAHDADRVSEALIEQGYRVLLLKEQQATRGSIEQALRNAAEFVDQSSATVVFFFSGHGFSDKGANYLATFEASSTDLRGTGLSIARVQDLLKKTGAKKVMTFIGACRNEVGKSAAPVRTFEELKSSTGLSGHANPANSGHVKTGQ